MPRASSPASNTARSPAVTILLAALVALGPVSTDLYLPSLPGLVSAFATDVAEVQLTLSVFLVGLAGGQLVYGPLSDRFGRRPVLIAGLVIYAGATVACALAPSMGVLIGARFLQAVGACAGPVLGRAIVRDVHGREGAARILSYMAAAMALAPAVGPILGGFLEVWFGWQANFVALLVYGVAGLAATLVLLPETNAHKDEAATRPLRIVGNYGALVRHREFLGYALCVAFAYSGIFSFISGSSFVLVDVIGLAPDQYGFCFAAIVVGYIAGTAIGGRITRRHGIDRMVALGAAVSIAGALVLVALGWFGPDAGYAGAAAIVLPMMVFMAGTGFVMPNSMAGAIGPFPQMAGSASALLGFLQMGVGAGVGIGVGHLHDGTARPMTTAIALAAVLVLLCHRFLVRPGQPRSGTA
jgi:DHA1 family bicyclomycin/chloramphenicol resistance-like MFS transporter